MSAAPRLRPAGPLDLAAVRSLAARSFAAHGDYGAILAGWFRARGVRTVVAEAGGALAGFAMWTVAEAGGGAAHGRLLAIAVEADRRRGGVGRALLGRVLADLVAAGVASVVLEVARDNGAARALFATAGFRVVPGGGGRYPGGAVYETMALPC